MKKMLLYSGCLLMCATNSYAQQSASAESSKQKPKYYLKGGLGYAFAMSGSADNYNGRTVTNNNNSVTNSKPASFSAGLNASLTGGLQFTKHIGAELNMIYGILPKSYTYSNETFTGLGISEWENEKYTGKAENPIFMTPSLVLQTGGEHVNAYMRMGVVLPLQNKLVVDGVLDNPTTLINTNITTRQEFKTRFTLGAAAAAGLSIDIGHDLCLWGEASIMSLSPYLKEGTITQFDVNGVSKLSGMPLSATKTAYEFSYKSSANQPADQPTKAQTVALPYSNVCISIGIKLAI